MNHACPLWIIRRRCRSAGSITSWGATEPARAAARLSIFIANNVTNPRNHVATGNTLNALTATYCYGKLTQASNFKPDGTALMAA